MADLNPAQGEVLAVLGAAPPARPTFDAELRVWLRAGLEEDLVELLAGADPSFELVLSKHTITSALGCERRFVAESLAPFPRVTPAMAKGTVAHKAIELTLNMAGAPAPGELVDEAIARLQQDDRWLSGYLRECGETERAELRGAAAELVTKFAETWPPLDRRWRPVTESSLTVELADARVLLRGKVDLTLGRAEGMRAGKVLVDFKSGRSHPSHVDDLRFYALVETLRIGTPPRLCATYYLDQGRFSTEEVTEAVLEAAAARVVAAARRSATALTDEGEASTSPSSGCRHCSELTECEPGMAEIDRMDNP